MKQTNLKVYGEDWVKEEIKKILKRYSIYYFMPSASHFGKSGIPDFVCCFAGLFLGIEAKATAPDPSELQSVQFDLIQKAGGATFLVNQYNLPNFESWISTVVVEHRRNYG